MARELPHAMGTARKEKKGGNEEGEGGCSVPPGGRGRACRAQPLSQPSPWASVLQSRVAAARALPPSFCTAVTRGAQGARPRATQGQEAGVVCLAQQLCSGLSSGRQTGVDQSSPEVCVRVSNGPPLGSRTRDHTQRALASRVCVPGWSHGRGRPSGWLGLVSFRPFGGQVDP